MENSQSTIQNEPTVATQTPSKQTNHKTILILKPILYSIVIIAIAIGSFLLGTQYIQTRPYTTAPTKTPQTTTQPSAVTTAIPTNNSSATEEWKTAKYSDFSYEYPAGWHVAELSQNNIEEDGVVLLIDPNPISITPRDGPIAIFQIQILNGNKNPDELLAKRMQYFNSEYYTDITKQTIDWTQGKIYHFTGKFPLDGWMGGENIETYYFMFNHNPDDTFNQDVFIASLLYQNDPKYSEMLRHIVVSFKKLTP